MKSHEAWRNLVVGLLLAVAFSGCDIDFGTWSQAEYEKTVSQEVACGTTNSLDVATQLGSIEITGTEGNECHLSVRIVARAPTEEEAQELAEQVEIRAESNGDALKVRADKPEQLHNRSISISYTITVPRRMSVLCDSGYGSLSVTDLTGAVKGKTGSGSVRTENLGGPVDLTTSYGSITCRRSAGATVLLQSSSGSITAADLKGSAKIRTSYGSITCTGFSGADLDLKTSSGRIALSDASFDGCLADTSYGSVVGGNLQGRTLKLRSGSGSVELTGARADTIDLHTSYGRIGARQITTGHLAADSGSGSIRIVCSPDTPADLTAQVKSSYGGIDFTAPPGFAGRVELSTGYGSVRTALPVTMTGEITQKKITGQIGQGTGLLRLETGSGSIDLK
jgi:DUF4097 and DUF4098 domain-containing protein YvlB